MTLLNNQAGLTPYTFKKRCPYMQLRVGAYLPYFIVTIVAPNPYS